MFVYKLGFPAHAGRLDSTNSAWADDGRPNAHNLAEVVKLTRHEHVATS